MKRRSNNNPDREPENITAFERLLAHNPKAKIVWVHLGMDTTDQRSPELTRRLLAKHQNLYINIKVNQRFAGKHWVFKGGRGLNPEWREVFMEFPGRFMVGTDGFYPSPMADVQNPLPIFREVLGTVKSLPPRIARMVAYENAERIYGLNVVEKKERTATAGPATPAPKTGNPKFLSGG